MLERIDLENTELAPCEIEAASLIEEANPLDEVEYPGDIEGDCAAELAAVKSAFAQRADAEKERVRKATDSEYWVCLVFQTREQAEEFLRQTKWSDPDEKYVDGRRAAKHLGIDLPNDGPPFGRPKIDQTWAAMARKE